MRYFIDTEFIEDGIILDLISIGIVSEDNREMYALNSGARLMRADSWVKKHVLAHLPGISIDDAGGVVCNIKNYNILNGWKPMHEIMLDILNFVGEDEKPAFWADYGAYDWVAFARCFGRLMDLPRGYPMYVRDLQMLLDLCGNPSFPAGFLDATEAGQVAHNAIDDARDLKKMFDYINDRFQFGVEDKEKEMGSEVLL